VLSLLLLIKDLHGSRHCQLLNGGLCLVVISDQTHDLRVYLEPLAEISGAIVRQHWKKVIRRERIGQCPLIAFDETKRTLAFLSTAAVGIHMLSE
jgi:hypothetical protein